MMMIMMDFMASFSVRLFLAQFILDSAQHRGPQISFVLVQ